MTIWPRLDYAADRATYETCHLILQLIGKLPTRLHPWINHGWHVALRVTPNGFVTRTMPCDGRDFAVAFNLYDPSLVITCQSGESRQISVLGKSIANLHRELSQRLKDMELPAPLWGEPNEIPDPVDFARDDRPRKWDRAAGARLHAAFLASDRVFAAFRSLYLGKTSPSHLFWGSFDLAVTRFSGRSAPSHPGGIPHLPDAVTREAYSHEVISAGFWLGGNGVDEAAYYAYAYPTPEGLGGRDIKPEAARWQTELGEFVLSYRVVAEGDDPDAVLMTFLQSTFDAAAGLLDWPAGLARQNLALGKPPA